MIAFEELAESYQYPVLRFDGERITWSNACARMFLSQRLNNLGELLEDEDTDALLEAFVTERDWRGAVAVGGTETAAELTVYGGKGYIVIKPDSRDCLIDQMLSDMGQMMKDPLNNLYNALSDLGDPGKRDDAAAVIKHSFYNLVRLSENQIAVSAQPACGGLMTVPIVGFMQDVIASANETLGDRNITVELETPNSEGVCGIDPRKLAHLLMLLIARAVRGGDGVTVNLRFDANACYIGVPMPNGSISLYDSSSYLTTAGTPSALESLENLTLTKIINSFNATHKSRVFTAAAKNTDMVVVAIETTSGGVVCESQPLMRGLRPDLIFLSDVLGKESYR